MGHITLHVMGHITLIMYTGIILNPVPNQGSNLHVTAFQIGLSVLHAEDAIILHLCITEL